jgi:hypothetical protein
MSRVLALGQRRFEHPQFALPSNKRMAARAGRLTKGAQSPRPDRLCEPFDSELTDLGAFDPFGERTVD